MSVSALLIAHGSRRTEANADLARLAEAVRAAGIYPLVEIAYLEVTQPDIPAGARCCVERGATEVRMLPYFLSAGAHVVEDLEWHRGELSAEFPHVRFVLCPPLGLHPLMIELVLERLRDGDSRPASADSADGTASARAGLHKRRSNGV